MDEVLHSERLDADGSKRRHLFAGAIETLPDGGMIEAAGEAFLVLDGALRRWTPTGYGRTETSMRVD
jgi:hypothetical protein